MAMVPRDAVSGSSRAVGRRGLDFGRDWDFKGQLSNGVHAVGENRVYAPSESSAQINIVLDASGSMNSRSDGQPLYKIVLNRYAELVTPGEGIRPDDMICVWSFNKRVRLLCEVKAKHYHRKKDSIQKMYEEELANDEYNNRTRLYSAVAHVVETKIKETSKTNSKMDFFLVTFTDGKDNQRGDSLDTMIKQLTFFKGRLHTYFITLNLPGNSVLRKRLHEDIKLIDCESTSPREISRAFNDVRDSIKAVLVYVISQDGVAAQTLTRIVAYGTSVDSLNKDMMDNLAKQMKNTSLIEAFHQQHLTYK